MKKLIFVLLLLSIFLLPASASADIISPGYKGVSYCLKVENADEFPGYVFVTQPWFGSFEVIENNKCISYYKSVEPTIYAVLESEYDSDTEFTLSAVVENNRVNANKSGDPLEEVVDIVRIDSVSESELKISTVKTINKYDDGKNKEIDHETGETKVVYSSNYIIIAGTIFLAIALIALIFIVGKIRRNRL